ncbi:MAG: 4Fe-4S dicluster domain-containing protein [Candidatus Omnitrophota bacterium]|nr:4Fe-4S dicluster domain-containing protein [Candidatus Omnitrophota bacterium]
MEKLFITKENLKVLIASLKKDCAEFIAPRYEHLDDIVLGDTKADGRELLNYEGNSVISPRAFLLPQTEELFEIKSAKNSEFIAVEDKKKRIFYGVRPCDIKALKLMEEFFIGGEFEDKPYKEKFRNSVFITLSCIKKCSPESFCFEMGSGPFAKEGFDLQLTPLNRGFLVEIGSKKGSQVIRKHKKLFSKAKPEDEKEVRTLSLNFTKGKKRINYKRLARIMRENKVQESIWDDIGQRCVVCSGCVTLCPTCSCFSIQDRLSGAQGSRFRYCDGCVYAGFTRMAGGSTPFPEHKDHIRRFFEHKLNIDTQRYGVSSCVGCGRCIQTCPGNISIRKFIEQAVDGS